MALCAAAPLLAAPALGLLVWVGAAEFNALGGENRLLGPGDLALTFANQNFALWLLGFLVVLACVLVGAARPAARPHPATAS